MDDCILFRDGTHRVKTSVSKYGSQQSNQQRTSLFVLAMDREWFRLREEGDVLPSKGKDGETGLAMEMATSVDKSSFFRRLQRNVTVQWENTVAHRALRFFIFTGRSFLCFIIVLNLFELQSFYIHRFDTRTCVYVCAREKLSISFFLQHSSNSTRLRSVPRNFEIEAIG